MTDQVDGSAAVVEEAAPKVDGRVLRSERTRTRILDATRRLIAAGDLRPAAGDVAASAGVSTRSIYQHFADVGALYAAALTPEMRSAIAARVRAMTDAELADVAQGAAMSWWLGMAQPDA